MVQVSLNTASYIKLQVTEISVHGVVRPFLILRIQSRKQRVLFYSDWKNHQVHVPLNSSQETQSDDTKFLYRNSISLLTQVKITDVQCTDLQPYISMLIKQWARHLSLTASYLSLWATIKLFLMVHSLFDSCSPLKLSTHSSEPSVYNNSNHRR